MFAQRYSISRTQQHRSSIIVDTENEPSSDVSTSIYSDDEIALVRMTEARDILAKELSLTKEQLSAEERLTRDLNQRLIMKAISIDCQLIETEDNLNQSKTKLDDTVQKNRDLSSKLRKLTTDNQSLIKRYAELEKTNRIQKSTIATSNAEIAKLKSTIKDFQHRFLSLASALVYFNEKNKDEIGKESSRDETISKKNYESKKNNEKTGDRTAPPGLVAQGFIEVRGNSSREEEWNAERNDLFGCIQQLQSNNELIKNKFFQTLKKHESAWHLERKVLFREVNELRVLLKAKYAIRTVTPPPVGIRRYWDKGKLELSDTFDTNKSRESPISASFSSSLSMSSLMSSSMSSSLNYSITDTSRNRTILSNAKNWNTEVVHE